MSIENKSNASGHQHSTLSIFYENTADFFTTPIRGKKQFFSIYHGVPEFDPDRSKANALLLGPCRTRGPPAVYPSSTKNIEPGLIGFHSGRTVHQRSTHQARPLAPLCGARTHFLHLRNISATKDPVQLRRTRMDFHVRSVSDLKSG